jgi:FKBP-type peptidyl-prolyl cis-trans isomerase FkpA
MMKEIMKGKFMRTKTAVCFCLVLATACKTAGNETAASDREALDADTSYAFGVVMGSQLKSFGFTFDYKAFADGLRSFIDGNATVTEDDALTTVQTTISASMTKMAEANLAKGTAFLEENAKKDGVISAENGLQYEVLTEAEGPKPGAASSVRVHYEGKLIDGTVFDSSYERGEPVEFPLNRVIPGWTQGLLLMSPGARYRLFIPPELGYGSEPVGNGVIPGNSVLIFEVELLEILPDEEED